MLVDFILDRKDAADYGEVYEPKELYDYVSDLYADCVEWKQDEGAKIYEKILQALDYGTEKDVRGALCNYIIKNNYNCAICDFICTQKWLEADK